MRTDRRTDMPKLIVAFRHRSYSVVFSSFSLHALLRLFFTPSLSGSFFGSLSLCASLPDPLRVSVVPHFHKCPNHLNCADSAIFHFLKGGVSNPLLIILFLILFILVFLIISFHYYFVSFSTESLVF